MFTTYLHFPPGASLPNLFVLTPMRVVVMIEADVTPAWWDAVSTWLVQSRCLYMMAWGRECSAWDDCIDYANHDDFEGEIPADRFVITTWHTDQSLAEVFWYAKHCATHAVVDVERTLLLHIATEPRETDMLDGYAVA